jgi:hypothetical protein
MVPYTNSPPELYLSPGTIEDPAAAEKVLATGGADAFIAVAAGNLSGFVQSFVANYSAGENECSCDVRLPSIGCLNLFIPPHRVLSSCNSD